jgi:hypothetical protein
LRVWPKSKFFAGLQGSRGDEGERTIDLHQIDPNIREAEVRAIDFNESTKTYLVGTRGAEVMEISA